MYQFFNKLIFEENLNLPIEQIENVHRLLNDNNLQNHWKNLKPVFRYSAEDGSYGTNGDGVFGFTPEGIYIEHNMKYVVSTVPLSFQNPVNRLTIIDVATEQQLNKLMDSLK